MIKTFLSILRDRETPLDQRVFALLEVVLFPVSLATVAAMFRQPFLRHYGYVPRHAPMRHGLRSHSRQLTPTTTQSVNF